MADSDDGGCCGCIVLVGVFFFICFLISSLNTANERLEKIEQKIELKSK